MQFHKLRINHETPFEMMPKVQKLTDYDYCLVHLVKDNPGYKQYFLDAIAKGRDVLLDNSVFELDTPFDPDEYVKAINELNPTWYIVPDFLDDKDKTIESMKNWIEKYLPLVKTKSKIIGSIQGKTVQEMTDCYKFMADCPQVDKIAITFNSLAYIELCPEIPAAKPGEEMKPTSDNLTRWMNGRIRFISELASKGIWCEKPHHLLGCGYAAEFSAPIYHFISVDTIDTSNPTIYGLKGLTYDKTLGNTSKPSMKLCDHLNDKLSFKQKRLIVKNVKRFRKLVNGKL